MKYIRLLSFTMATILILTMFSSCKGKTGPTLDEKPNDIEENKIVFSETIEKTEKEGLYEVGKNLTTNTESIDVVAGSETAYILTQKESSLEVVHFSVFENKTLATTNISGNQWNYGVLEKDGFYAVELSSATLFVYEKSGEKKSETKIDEGALSFAFLQKGGENLIYKKADSNNIYKLNIQTKEKINTSETFEISGQPSYDEEAVYVKTSLGRSYRIAFKDLTVTKTLTEPFREYVGPLGIATEGEYFTVTTLDTGREKIMVKKQAADEEVICADETRFITTQEKKQNYFRFYSFYEGYTTEEIGDESEKLLDVQFIGEDYIFAAVRNISSQKNIYRLLKISEDTNRLSTTSNHLFETTVYSSALVGDQTIDTAETDKLADSYKVRFLYGKMGDDFKTDFTYGVAKQKEVLPLLEEAEVVLRGISSELLIEATNNREIWVYLCKDLNNKGTEFSTFSGQTELYNHKVIFIDISNKNYSLTELLCHEFAHILDDYMADSLLSGFSELTDSKIKKEAYKNSYTAELTDKYTQKDSENSEAWFYNKYCKISEEEDRVVTLGEMFNALIDSVPADAFKEENVKKKASFMAKAIEESFDFCKATKGQPWEMYIIE